MEEVVAMAPGAIIELPKPADEDLEILVNNKAIGTGRAVKVGENFGLRVSYIGDLKQRIAAMAERDGSQEQGGEETGEETGAPDPAPIPSES